MRTGATVVVMAGVGAEVTTMTTTMTTTIRKQP
jgi:hypothetical protein